MHAASADAKMLSCMVHAQDQHLHQPAGGAASGRVRLREPVLRRVRLRVVAVQLLRPRAERRRRGRRRLRHARPLLGVGRHRRSCQAVSQQEQR